MENTCSICGVKYKGFGNNAQPINNGRCCDACNQEVIYQRIAMLLTKPISKPKKLCKNGR